MWPLLSLTQPTPPCRRAGRSAVAGCATTVKVVAWTTAATVVQARMRIRRVRVMALPPSPGVVGEAGSFAPRDG